AILNDAEDAGEAILADCGFELAAKPAALLGACKNTTDFAPAELRDCRDEIEPALPSRQPAGKHHDRHAVGQAPLVREVDDALRADPVRIEDFEIDAARDRSQPVAADPIDTGGMVGDEIRNRDHPLAPRHD